MSLSRHSLKNLTTHTGWLFLLGLVLCLPGVPAQADTWALLVGVEKYESAKIPPLDYAVADVKSVATAMQGNWNVPADHVRLLTSDLPATSALYPTNINVLTQLGLLSNQVKAGDTFVFYFSGHGFQRKEGQFLATVNTVPFSVATLRASALNLEELGDALQSVPARRKLFVLDACRNDPERARGLGDNPMTSQLRAKLRDLELVDKTTPNTEAGGPPATAKLFSCQEGQRSWEEPELGHGVFTHYLLQGIAGDAAAPDGTVDAYRLCTYVQSQVSDWSRQHLAPDKQQIPDFEIKGTSIPLGRVKAIQPPVVPVAPVPLPDPEEIGTTAKLHIESTPAGAKVFVDGQERGTTPCDITVELGLSPTKTLEVGLSLNGFRALLRRVTLMRGQTTPLSLTLEKVSTPLPVTPPPSRPTIDYRSLQASQTLTGHTLGVNAVSFSPDGRTLASASADKTIKLWDMATGQQLKTFIGHKDYVHCVSFSPDGRTLASGSDDTTVKLWDVATGKELKTFNGHTCDVYSVSFSPDGRTLAGAGDDNTIKLWDVATGKELETFNQRVAYRVINCVSFGPDGRTLAQGGSDLILWDVATGQFLKTLGGHKGGVFSVAFSPDGRTLASAGLDTTVKLWDVATGKELKTFKGHTNIVWSIRFSPDGRTLVSSSSDKTIRIWDVATGQELKTLQTHKDVVTSVAFSADGRTLSSASGDKTIKLWQLSK